MPLQADYERRLSALRGWLRGRGYFRALSALEYARKFHNGLRKDGLTHEFEHQVAIAFHVIDLPGIIYPEDTLVTVFLHDLIEDHGAHHEIAIANRWGERVREAAMAVTKKIPHFVNGAKAYVIERDEGELYQAMARNPIASIVKAADRSHNQKTMSGVFSREKQVNYVDFTASKIIPMLKLARREFPEQYAAYLLLQDKLESQAALVNSWAKAA